MKEIIKKNAAMGISLIFGMTLVDIFYKKEFTLAIFITRTVTMVVMYALFSWIEYSNSKKEKK